MPKKRGTTVRRKKGVDIWAECRVCMQQMVGGPRCYEHNPTPEMRLADPGRYGVLRLESAAAADFEKEDGTDQ